MSSIRAPTCCLLAAASIGCTHRVAPEPQSRPYPTVILVSLDGFRWDYRQRGVSPSLDRLAATGVSARALVPVFPTLTFPNHYTIVTGLFAEHHGIVSNTMYDPATGARFRLGDTVAVRDPRWWEGEPIWVTAAKQGLVTAAFFWPGTEAEIAGVRPTYWKPFDNEVPYEERVRQVLAWLDLPPDQRPSFVTMYFSSTDAAAHDHPLDSPQVTEGIRRADAAVGMLVEGLERRARLDSVYLLVISDHGMAPLSRDRVIFLEDYVSLDAVDVSEWSPVLGLWPKPDRENEVYAALERAHPRLSVWRRAQIPERFHYRAHRRIPPIVGLAEEGWTITTRARLQRAGRLLVNTHGFDPALPSMHGIFIGHGPRLRRGVVLEPFGSVHLYALMAELLGLRPAPHDGSLDSVRAVLRN